MKRLSIALLIMTSCISNFAAEKKHGLEGLSDEAQIQNPAERQDILTALKIEYDRILYGDIGLTCSVSDIDFKMYDIFNPNRNYELYINPGSQPVIKLINTNLFFGYFISWFISTNSDLTEITRIEGHYYQKKISIKINKGTLVEPKIMNIDYVQLINSVDCYSGK